MLDKVPPAETVVKVKKTALIPIIDNSFGNLAQDISTKWNATPTTKLSWTTNTEFADIVKNYNTVLSDRHKVGNTRPQLTGALENINSKINNSLAYVKGYINEKYKKESALSYYPSFGIQHKNRVYVLPKAHYNRSTALNQMIISIEEHGFSKKEYGSEFWKATKLEYDSLINNARRTDSDISEKVMNKNTLRNSIKKVINSLILNIKSNNPDGYKVELRVWGFHKEKY